MVLGVETKKPSEEKNKKLLKKVEDYLKSDSYMYAPLIGAPPPHGFDANTVSPHSGTFFFCFLFCLFDFFHLLFVVLIQLFDWRICLSHFFSSQLGSLLGVLNNCFLVYRPLRCQT